MVGDISVMDTALPTSGCIIIIISDLSSAAVVEAIIKNGIPSSAKYYWYIS